MLTMFRTVLSLVIVTALRKYQNERNLTYFQQRVPNKSGAKVVEEIKLWYIALITIIIFSQVANLKWVIYNAHLQNHV